MTIIDQGNRMLQQMQGANQYQGQWPHAERVIEKDPKVDSAADAVRALTKRAEELRGHLNRVDGWTKELAKVERMLAAAAEDK